MYAPHHVYPTLPPPPRPTGVARTSGRARAAALTVRAGELSILVGWRLVDTGLVVRDGTGWLPQHARPPGG